MPRVDLPVMKLPYILLFLGASGLAVSVYALQSRHTEGDGEAQTTYFANGQIRCESRFQDGHREGASTSFYSDGKKMSEGSYSAGKMEGDWTYWRADGTIDNERSGTYHDGEKPSARVVDARTDP